MRWLAAAALVVAGCNPPFRPVAAPAASADGTEVRVEAMAPGGKTKVQLIARTHAGPAARLERALLTRVTRAACTGGSPVEEVAVDGAAPAKVPVRVGEHTLGLSFTPGAEELLDAPTALDLAVDDGERVACVRTLLGPSAGWERWQPSFEVDLGGGVPRGRSATSVPSTCWRSAPAPWSGPSTGAPAFASASAGATSASTTTALLPGPVVAATVYLAPERRAGPAVQLSYASLFELMHLPSGPHRLAIRASASGTRCPASACSGTGSARREGARSACGAATSTRWGSRCTTSSGLPTLHAERPAMVLGLAVVWRLAL